jgi:hypothetical protein
LPQSTVTPHSDLQRTMAFRLVDPIPFLPPGMQRRVVHGRPVMRRVVVGPIHQTNNDLAIVRFHPPPAPGATF